MLSQILLALEAKFTIRTLACANALLHSHIGVVSLVLTAQPVPSGVLSLHVVSHVLQASHGMKNFKNVLN